MYNENDRNQYEYHYSYQQPAEPAEPVVIPEQKRRKGTGGWKRFAAGVLCGVLLVGGSFTGGWFVKDWVNRNQVTNTSILYSQRPKAEVATVSVDGSTELTFPEIYAANVNSCVSINVSSTAGYNFFGQPVQSASSGSGFIITDDGYIVTNNHVVENASSVEVTLNSGATYTAQVIGTDSDYDIAVIKVDPGEDKLQPVVLGDSGKLSVGDAVVAIGNPLGELTFSMSEGIVSCVDREINLDGTPFNMIQTTAAINSGNSGGPLFNSYGEVIGIVSAKYSSSSSGSTASVEGLGFAIPMADVMDMIKDIMENGQVTSHAYMGISHIDVGYYPQLGLSAGVYVAEVVEDGPAAKAGLQVGDVITMLDSTIISSSADLQSAVGSKSYRAGDVVTVTYVRDGKVMTTELTFGSTIDAPKQDASEQQSQQSQQQSGQSYSSPYGGMQEFFERYFGY